MPGSRRALLLGTLGAFACRAAPRGRCVTSAGPPGLDAPGDALTGADGEITGTLDVRVTGALDEALAAMHTASRAPGVSAAVAVAGRGMWTAQRGLAVASPETPLPADARFQAASVGKLMTAVTVLRLVERGELDLHAPLARWFPDFKESAGITVDHLLRHTSGVHDFSRNEDNLKYREPSVLIAEAAAGPAEFCPGAAWSYSNTGYVLLGKIVEAVRGAPFAAVLNSEIFESVGVRSTAVNVPGVVPVVRGHHGGVPVPMDVDYATPYAAGGVASTAGDLVRVLHATLSGRLLAAETVRSMLRDTQVMFGDETMRYGAGLMFYKIDSGPGVMVGHSGGARGCRAVVAYVRADAAYVSVMFNYDDAAAEAGLWALVRALRAVDR